jgi:predicted TPR repeat methyltransferase
MPESQQPIEGQNIMVGAILTKADRIVLDVGAGDGKWGGILKGKVKKIVALEVWLPLIEPLLQSGLYDEVIEGNVRGFLDWDRFNTVILGDVLEHFCRKKGMRLVETLKLISADVYLTIPISPCPQDGMVYGNPYETHHEQWKHEELTALGFKLLHRGMNEAGTVEIGTYIMERKDNGV